LTEGDPCKGAEHKRGLLYDVRSLGRGYRTAGRHS
jgi:hypothetical protein